MKAVEKQVPCEEKLDVTKIDEKSPQALNKTSLYRLFYVKPQKVVLKTHFFNLSVNQKMSHPLSHKNPLRSP